MRTPLLVGVVLMVHVVALSCVFLMPGCRTYDVDSTVPVATTEQGVKMPPATIVDELPVAAPVEKIEPKETLKAETTEYVIGKNECLSKIASQYKLSVSEILALNNMKDANKIRVGQKIQLPGNIDISKRPKPLKAKESAPAAEKSTASDAAPSSDVTVPASDATEATADTASGATYIVKKGDILGSIAKEHKVKISALKKANKMSNDNIRIGQKLIIPGAVSSESAAPVNAVPADTTAPAPADAAVPAVDNPSAAPAVTPAATPEVAPAVVPPEAPAVQESAPAAATTVLKKHKVMPGEDVYGIGILYNVSIQKLKEVNNLTTDKPAAGTELVIPDSV